MMRIPRIIAVSGTPGTGKTTLAKQLCRWLDYSYVDVNSLIRRENFSSGFDKKRKCRIIDTGKLNDALIALIKKSNKNKKIKGMVIDSHLSHFLPRKYVDLCIITVCPLPVLRRRLHKRGYPSEKIRENLDAEIFIVCLLEATQMRHKILRIDTSSPKKTIQSLLMKQIFR